MPAEARAIGGPRGACAAGGDPVRCETASGALWLAVSGLGYECARYAAAALLDRGVEALVSAGCAAGLDARLEPGDLSLPLYLVDRNACRLAVCATWHTALCARLAGSMAVHTAPLVHTRDVLATVEAKRALARASGAAVADMESAAVARVASERAVPFLCVRAVADGASLALPRAALAAVGAQGRILPGRALRELVHSPRELRAIGALGAGFARARTTLRRVSAATGRTFCAASI